MLKPTPTAAHSTRWLLLPAALALAGVVLLAAASTLAIVVLFCAAAAALVAAVRLEVGNGWAVGQCTLGAALSLVAVAAQVIARFAPPRLLPLVPARTIAGSAREHARQVVTALESKLQVVHTCIHAARVLTARAQATAS